MIKVESSIDLDYPLEEAFAFVTDASNDPLLHTDVREARRVSDRPVEVGSEFIWVVAFAGREQAIARITELKPTTHARLEVKFRFARSALIYDLAPLDGGTRFTRRVEMRMRGPLRVVESFMRSKIAKQNERFLSNLEQALSGGRR